MSADISAIAKRRAAAETIRGCGDNSCCWQRSSGMSTNGGCRCADQRQGPRIIQWAASARTDIDALMVEVEQLRGELDVIRAGQAGAAVR